MRVSVGLVLGKFMPLHSGHELLINWAVKKCDKLYVLVCTQDNEPIDPQNRFLWVRKTFENNHKIEVVRFHNELPNSSESSRDISKVWSEYLKERFPDVTVFFGSERYVEYVAEYMNIDYEIFDEKRIEVPISATDIRNNPIQNWDYISEYFKEHFVKKICIFGPESCGKSTLTKNLAKHFNTAFVPEMARQMIDDGGITMDDLQLKHLEEFAIIQKNMVISMTKFAKGVLFCDTDNLTTQVFAKEYFNRVSETISCQNKIKYDLYFLLTPDVPWINDGQRNLGHKRWEMFNKCKDILDEHNVNYVVIDGDWNERFQKSVNLVKKLIYK